MKKIIVACMLIMAFAVGCKEKPAEIPEPVPAPETESIPQDLSGIHNSMNSLDYMGTYMSESPVIADIQKVELLPDSMFRMEMINGDEITGVYNWDATGSVITLTQNDQDDIIAQFFVGENFIRLVSGNAEGQIFRKQ